MPHVLAIVLIGAGIGAGLKWLAGEVGRAAEGAKSAHEELSPEQRVAASPKDLGALEWDAEAGVYRPSRRRAG